MFDKNTYTSILTSFLDVEDPNQITEKEEKPAWVYLRMFTKMEPYSTTFLAIIRNLSFANNKKY